MTKALIWKVEVLATAVNFQHLSSKQNEQVNVSLSQKRKRFEFRDMFALNKSPWCNQNRKASFCRQHKCVQSTAKKLLNFDLARWPDGRRGPPIICPEGILSIEIK